MPEVRLTVDEGFMNSLKNDTGITQTTKLADEALTLFKWAVAQAKEGRILISTDQNGGNAQRIVMPSLENAKLKS